MALNIKSFRAQWDNWKISWRWSTNGNSTIQLPVTFTLELDAGSSPADCEIVQLKRGRSQYGSTAADVFPNFTVDGNFWLLGTATNLTWDGAVATFEDAPGFDGAPGSLFMGPADGGPGYFDFLTQVRDTQTHSIIRQIAWSMRIDVPTPGHGGFWWSFSDQK